MLEDLGVLLRRHCLDHTVTKAVTGVLLPDLLGEEERVGLFPVAMDAAACLYRLVGRP